MVAISRKAHPLTALKLIMRTLNNGRSAFVSIAFSKNFFEYFSVANDGERKYQMKAKVCGLSIPRHGDCSSNFS